MPHGSNNSSDDAMTREEEARLIERARSGSADHFDELVRAFGPRLYNFLLRRVSRVEDVEDLVQESFLRAWTRLDTYDAKYRFSTWLFTIGARAAVDQYRKNKARPDRGSLLAMTSTRQFADGSIEEPSDIASRCEGNNNLWTLVEQTLNPAQRAVLWLRYAEDMSVRDIAVVLDRSAVTVGVLLFRARQALAEAIRQAEQETERPRTFRTNTLQGSGA